MNRCNFTTKDEMLRTARMRLFNEKLDKLSEARKRTDVKEEAILALDTAVRVLFPIAQPEPEPGEEDDLCS